MNKFLPSITLTLICVTQIFSQTVITPSDYDALKKSNALKPNERYVFTKENNGSGLSQKILPTVSHVDSAQAACSCLIPLDSSFSVVPFSGYTAPDYRNDDGSTSSIPLPFDFQWHGNIYTSFYINSNGNISLDTPYSTFSASGFPSSSYVMIAPFWADVDTRNTSSGVVYYKMDAHKVVVLWDHVGYYNQYVDKLNTFELIITDGTDSILPNGNDVGFCFGDMQWTTGDASQGVNGFGGTAATVGVNLGDGVNFGQITRSDSQGYQYDGPNNNNDGVDWLDYRSFYFNLSDVNGIAAFAYDTLCDSIIDVADSLASPFRVCINPMDQNDTITYSYDSLPLGMMPQEIYAIGSKLIDIYFYPVDTGLQLLDIKYSDQKGDGQEHHYKKWFNVSSVSTTIGIKSISVGSQILYPNPTSGIINITNADPSAEIKVFDILGNQLLNVKGTNTIDISGFEDGVYSLIISGKGKQQRFKIVKTR